MNTRYRRFRMFLALGLAGLVGGSILSSFEALAACVAPPAGLVGWWRGEANAEDRFNGNTGYLSNGVSFAASEVGQGFNLDGSSGYVRVGASESLNVGVGEGLTIEAWIKPNDLSFAQPLVEFNDGVNLGAQLWISEPWFGGQGGPGDLFANMTDPSGGTHALVSLPGVLNTTSFQHVAVTYDRASGTGVLYVNGVVVYAHNLGYITPQTSYDLYFGVRPSNQYPSIYSGLIDEVSLYSRALSQAEIQAIVEAGSAGKCVSDSAPIIITQPTNQTVMTGGTASFNVTATGTGPLSYQWSFNGGDLPGATSPGLTIQSVQLTQAGDYTVTVSNTSGSATSAPATLTVTSPTCTPAPSGLVSWWKAEGNGDDSAGSNTAFPGNGISFASGEAGQGFGLDGISGYVLVNASPSLDVGLGAGLTIEAWVRPADLSFAQPLVEFNDGYNLGVQLWISEPWFGGQGGPGDLFANITDPSGGTHALVSAPGVLNTNAFQHVAVTYDKTTGAGVLYVNGVVVYSHFLGTFTPETAYDLYFGIRPSPQYPSIYGGLMDEVSLYSRALSQSEIQSIVMAGTEGKCPLSQAPVIISQPTGQTMSAGGTATFTVTATGAPVLKYQWSLNGIDLAGATSPSLQLANVQPDQAGDYVVVVTNAAGAVTSSVAVLAVSTNLPGCFPAPADLVSWWKAENNGEDGISGNTGYLSNGVSFASGEVDQAFALDGTSGYVRALASSSLDVGLGDGLTIEAWVKPLDLSYAQPLVEFNDGTNLGVHLWISEPYFEGQGGPGDLFANLTDPSGGTHALVSLPGVLNTSSFQHVAVTYDKASGAGVLYVNGTVVYSHDLGVLTPQTSYDLYFGVRPSSQYPAIYKGLIDEVGLYSRALSQAEIQGIVSAGIAGKCAPSNRPPVAASVTTHTRENRAISIVGQKLLSEASDPDGDAITISGVSAASTNGGTVVFTGGNIVYTPATNFSGIDRFTYSISDSRGGKATASILVDVNSAGVIAARILPPAGGPGHFEISFSGTPGRTYTLQRSTTIAGPWTALSPVATGPDGKGNYTDATAPAKSAFYRVVYP